jgi:hypothetical protein
MSSVHIFLITLVLGLAVALLVGLLGFLVGGLFLVAMIPIYGRGRWAAVAGSLVGFGAAWSLLIGLQLGRGGASDNDPLWVAVGVVPLVIGLAVALTLIIRRPPGPDGRAGDALP